MTTSARAEPWRSLPADVADVIAPELPGITEDILDSIAAEVPEYARPLEGSFGRGVRTGVTEALAQFVELIRDPDRGRERGREVYRALGRGELRQGRTLDALQAAYRVGARVAWRRIARAAREAPVDPEVLSALAEAIFAYIDELSADSVEGYAQAQSELEGERQRRRRELLAMLLSEVPVARADLEPAAALAAWSLPRSAAALACNEGDLGRIARRLPADVLAAPHQGAGCVVIPDPGGPGRGTAIAAAADGLGAALGPSGQVAKLAASWSLARAALRAADAAGAAPTELVMAEDRLAKVLVSENRVLIERIAERRLRPLGTLSPAARTRLEKTALAYVQQHGNAAAMARALHVHPQTVRYRLSRLRKLLGGSLDDPDGRFELEVALRASGVTVP